MSAVTVVRAPPRALESRGIGPASTGWATSAGSWPDWRAGIQLPSMKTVSLTAMRYAPCPCSVWYVRTGTGSLTREAPGATTGLKPTLTARPPGPFPPPLPAPLKRSEAMSVEVSGGDRGPAPPPPARGAGQGGEEAAPHPPRRGPPPPPPLERQRVELGQTDDEK